MVDQNEMKKFGHKAKQSQNFGIEATLASGLNIPDFQQISEV